MAIIVSKNGKDAEKIDPSAFGAEAYLQRYIVENPASLPLYEIGEDVRLLVAAREFPTPSGPIDALGVDAEGRIYVIEAKLYKNPDKRLVLAQVFDYGAALWRRYGGSPDFAAKLDEHARKHFDLPLRQKAMDFFGISEQEVACLLEQARGHLDDGRLRFVILMDHLDERMRDLILFVNQNSRFDLYGVELEFYRYDDYEILIPRLFGAEVQKTGGTGSARKRWDEGSFLEQASTALEGAQLESVRAMLAFAKERCDDMGWGSGAVSGSFSPKFFAMSPKSLYTVYADGRLVLNFGWLHESDSTRGLAGELGRRVRELPGFALPEGQLTKHVTVPAEAWTPQVADFLKVIEALLARDS